jgi:hypothetical protein
MLDFNVLALQPKGNVVEANAVLDAAKGEKVR